MTETKDYENPRPVVVALIPIDGHGLVIAKRAIEPRLGQWAFPAGWVNKLESAETAAERETMEETGLVIKLWCPVTTRITPRNQLLIFMLSLTTVRYGDLSKFDPALCPETLELHWGSENTADLAFPLHTEILRLPELWASGSRGENAR